jgi:hypothetical protein
VDADFARIEAFYGERSAPVFHEVSPLADKTLLPLLASKGYCPVEFTNVMYLPLAARATNAGNKGVRVRIAGATEREIWAQTATEGWQDSTEFADLVLDLARVAAARDGAKSFLAEIDGIPIAAGVLLIHGGVALLAGASTIPRWRKRGAQLALLEARLRDAESCGCDVAMMCAEPGSASQRNAERHGFRIAYTRIKWGKRS